MSGTFFIENMSFIFFSNHFNVLKIGLGDVCPNAHKKVSLMTVASFSELHDSFIRSSAAFRLVVVLK